MGKRHRRIRARSATGQVAGAATEKPGLEAHRPKRPAQPAFSQKAPRPSRPNPSPPPDTTKAFKEQFHAPTSGSLQDRPSSADGASTPRVLARSAVRRKEQRGGPLGPTDAAVSSRIGSGGAASVAPGHGTLA
jgi:hypothetical protein